MPVIGSVNFHARVLRRCFSNSPTPSSPMQPVDPVAAAPLELADRQALGDRVGHQLVGLLLERLLLPTGQAVGLIGQHISVTRPRSSRLRAHPGLRASSASHPRVWPPGPRPDPPSRPWLRSSSDPTAHPAAAGGGPGPSPWRGPRPARSSPCRSRHSTPSIASAGIPAICSSSWRIRAATATGSDSVTSITSPSIVSAIGAASHLDPPCQEPFERTERTLPWTDGASRLGGVRMFDTSSTTSPAQPRKGDFSRR